MSPVKSNLSTKKLVNDVLATIEREREREIVSKRFGLFDRKETLEQIGETLGITRERVRQLEKSVISHLKQNAEQGKLNQTSSFGKAVVEKLSSVGQITKTANLADMLVSSQDREEQSRILS